MRKIKILMFELCTLKNESRKFTIFKQINTESRKRNLSMHSIFINEI